jgi:glycosyltransferase involved in cell wall biosynthesis/SAM-dependent methyltransferase
MRIAHIQYSFAPENGGPTRSLTNYCLGQAAAGHAVSLWTVEGYPQWSPAIRLPPPVEMRVFQVELPAKLGRSAEMRRQLRLADSPDIYHLHGLWLHAMRYGADEARHRGVPYVLELAGMYEPLGLRQKWFPKRIARWWYQDRILHEAACLHVNSPQEAENIRKLGFKTPIAVIPVGVDLEEIEKRKAAIGRADSGERRAGSGEQGAGSREQGEEGRGQTAEIRNRKSEIFPELDGRPFVLYLSRIHPKKGLDLLIRAWAKICKERRTGSEEQERMLVIAGSGEPEYVSQCRQLAADAGIADQCLWLGHVDESQKSRLFAQARCFVLPTSGENFGNTVAEALAHGTPVITTIHTPWRELAEHQCGWCVDNTEPEIGRALREAFGLDAAARARMSDSARRLVEDRYSLQSVLKDINAVYEWLLGRAGVPDCVELPPARVEPDNGHSPAAAPTHASEAAVRIEGHKEVEALFDRKAATWSRKYGPNGSLRPRLYAFEGRLDELVKPPAAVLDFGCGTGNLACHLSARGYAVSACDLSFKMIEWARKTSPASPISWQVLPVGWPALPFAANTFDAIVASSVFEYLPVLQLPLAEFSRILKPGGYLIATVPNIQHLTRKIEKFLRPIAFMANKMPLFHRNPRLKSYATYLHCSINRMPLDVWFAIGGQAGFEPVAQDGSRASKAALVFLIFRKQTTNPSNA